MKSVPFIVVVLVAASAWAQSGPRTVLFVCEHGAAKSVVAAAHFNKLAAERGLPFRAIARGTAPDPSIPGRITEELEGEGLRVPPGYSPALVTAGDVSGASRVITFDVTLPVTVDASRLDRWDRLPAFSDAYAPASAAIAAKADALLREFERMTKKQ
jgi:protein-tyrosine-phosphatase